MRSVSRLKPYLYGSAALALAGAALFSSRHVAAATTQQPVYVYLMARITDHVNLDMSEDRLRHVISEVERYRQAYPQTHTTATVLFSGAVSKALQDRNPQTHILDFVKDSIHRGVIEAAYDGTDEPTYDVRPMLNIQTGMSPDDRWKMRQTVARQFLSENRDPLKGGPANGSGGLKAMQEVFGPAAYLMGMELAAEQYRPPVKVTSGPLGAPPPGGTHAAYGVFREWGGDTETLQMLRPYNSAALMFGVPAANPAQLPGYREAVSHFGKLMSPAPDTSPELYWQDYVLRVSESAPPVHPVKAIDGLEALQGVLNNANRSTVQVVEVELGAAQNYLQADFGKTAANAPVKYAYEHPQSPYLPANALRSTAEVNAGWDKENASLKWLAEQYFPNNLGSHFVSNADLAKMAGASTGFRISTPALRTALDDAIAKIGIDTHLFNYLRVEDHYLSLAEVFQVLADELAEYHRTGKLPESVQAAKVYGPYRLVTGHGPNIGEISAGDLETACAQFAPALHDDIVEPSNGIQRNSIRPLLKIDGMDLNPAQMIRLMALALNNPAPETKLPVRMSYMVAEAGAVVPKTRPLFDIGFVWTLKPAPLAIGN